MCELGLLPHQGPVPRPFSTAKSARLFAAAPKNLWVRDCHQVFCIKAGLVTRAGIVATKPLDLRSCGPCDSVWLGRVLLGNNWDGRHLRVARPCAVGRAHPYGPTFHASLSRVCTSRRAVPVSICGLPAAASRAWPLFRGASSLRGLCCRVGEVSVASICCCGMVGSEGLL